MKTTDFELKNISEIPDDVLDWFEKNRDFTFSSPWQVSITDSSRRDSDGFLDNEKDLVLKEVQENLFKKFQRNPQVNTSIRGITGRIAGLGFETTSDIWEVQEVISEIELDKRNRLYNFVPKWVARSKIEGELFICLTVHKDGFVETDFICPTDIEEIIWHPTKSLMPLFYQANIGGDKVFIPSIYIAHYPDLENLSIVREKIGKDGLIKSKQGGIGNKLKYKRFIVAWDKGFMQRRAMSYLLTVIEWLNYYENLKKYEIDHKKSSGMYAWVFSFDNIRSFMQWLSLTDEQKRETALMAKPEPGAKLFLPPGITVDLKSPNLTSITDQDTDIMRMVTSGLNETDDVTTGNTKGSTFSSLSASRGPMSDRTSDEIAYFDRFWKHDFWSAIFYLRSKVNSSFKLKYKRNVCIGFTKKGKPILKKKTFLAEQCIEVSYPTSETINYSERAKGMLGTKHGPISEQIGTPKSLAANVMGIGNYRTQRMRKAVEDEEYPTLEYENGIDAEKKQEKTEGEPSKNKSNSKGDEK
jgi:hypothetical protein